MRVKPKREPREPTREPTMIFSVNGRELRIYATVLESMDTDDQGWPTINGRRVSPGEIRRGWVEVR
jgi:hypothetical protein